MAIVERGLRPPPSATPRAVTRSVVVRTTQQFINVQRISDPDPDVNPFLAAGFMDNAGEIAWLLERSECATRQALADTPMAPLEGMGPAYGRSEAE